MQILLFTRYINFSYAWKVHVQPEEGKRETVIERKKEVLHGIVL
jgi:hypothetical protein